MPGDFLPIAVLIALATILSVVVVHFYLVAVLFILFDIEIIFLLPWAIVLRKLDIFGLIEMAIFIVILLVGYIYAWKKGALEWE
jgi:NADH-quinone oxidoreductase subunit A